MGDEAKAQSHISQALDIQVAVLGEEHQETAGTLDWLARSHESVGDYAEAEALLRRALEIDRKLFGEEDARSFIQHGDSTTSGISRQAIGLETHFYVVTPRLGDTVGRIDISDDVKAHIRRLRAKRGH